MFGQLAARRWADECGAVIAAEYLMLGTIVTAGSATGLVAVRDAMVSECEDFGQSVRDIRKAYTPAALQRKPAASQAAPVYAPLMSDGLGNDPQPATTYNIRYAAATP
jgi:hypothetical protein